MGNRAMRRKRDAPLSHTHLSEWFVPPLPGIQPDNSHGAHLRVIRNALSGSQSDRRWAWEMLRTMEEQIRSLRLWEG